MTDFPIQQIVNGNGEIVDDRFTDLVTEDLVKSLYKKMVFARAFDNKCVNLQRQGRIGTYVPFEGQEAAQVGSAYALRDDDWMFPTYRDHGATLTFGHSMKSILMYWNGRYEGTIAPEGKRIFPPAVPIASQLLHATGAAWAEKKKGTDRVAIVYFGDGATSEGDFHEGLNFASVFQTPTIFFNQNNGFAISVPMAKQMHSKTIAQKAVGYDIEGVRVDGNDVLAVYFATKKAADSARNGNGPSLIEAVTWRYGAHTTADDPTKYRDQAENEERREKYDPITRLEKLMKANGYWDDSMGAMQEQASDELEKAVAEMEKAPKADINDLFDHVFEEKPWTIAEQKQAHPKVRGGVN